jgi:hypothetical protein
MRVLALAVLMVGGLAVAVPASAEEFVGARVGGVGVGVDVGPHHRYRDRVVTERRVYRDDYARARCKTVIIHEGNMTRKIKKCRD